MKKKATSQSAFFNLRVLIGLFVGMTGISLALLAANPFGQKNSLSPAQIALIQQKYGVASSSIDPLVPAAVDCSRIKELGIDKQENLRAGAIMIFCGLSEGGKASHGNASSKLAQKLMAPLAFGSTDVDLITGAESFPNVTQSETFTTANPDNPNQIVVAYNDSRGRNFNPINMSGASVSTDGGTTFTRLTKANAQSPFDNTMGDPVILYNKPTATWYTVWLDAGCGSQGLGGYNSTTPWDPNSWTHYCIHTNSQDDRESGRADNNPSSTFYGRMYVSWNDTYAGPTFMGPCRSSSGYFATMYDNPAYWRHMGWGQPAAYNGVVHYVYAAKNGSDPGDVFYIRSTDMGVTFSGPFQLNSNTDATKAQWEPSLSVSDAGTVLATWYDETPRVADSCQPSSPSTPCYEMHSRKSNDNGVTWLADDTLSDIASPLPLQPDPGIQGTYSGDYDYGSAIAAKHVTS